MNIILNQNKNYKLTNYVIFFTTTILLLLTAFSAKAKFMENYNDWSTFQDKEAGKNAGKYMFLSRIDQLRMPLV